MSFHRCVKYLDRFLFDPEVPIEVPLTLGLHADYPGFAVGRKELMRQLPLNNDDVATARKYAMQNGIAYLNYRNQGGNRQTTEVAYFRAGYNPQLEQPHYVLAPTEILMHLKGVHGAKELIRLLTLYLRDQRMRGAIQTGIPEAAAMLGWTRRQTKRRHELLASKYGILQEVASESSGRPPIYVIPGALSEQGLDDFIPERTRYLQPLVINDARLTIYASAAEAEVAAYRVEDAMRNRRPDQIVDILTELPPDLRRGFVPGFIHAKQALGEDGPLVWLAERSAGTSPQTAQPLMTVRVTSGDREGDGNTYPQPPADSARRADRPGGRRKSKAKASVSEEQRVRLQAELPLTFEALTPGPGKKPPDQHVTRVEKLMRLHERRLDADLTPEQRAAVDAHTAALIRRNTHRAGTLVNGKRHPWHACAHKGLSRAAHVDEDLTAKLRELETQRPPEASDRNDLIDVSAELAEVLGPSSRASSCD